MSSLPHPLVLLVIIKLKKLKIPHVPFTNIQSTDTQTDTQMTNMYNSGPRYPTPFHQI